MSQNCENCQELQKSILSYVEALHETSKLVAYLLDPAVNDQERTRIREDLQKFGQTVKGTDVDSAKQP